MTKARDLANLIAAGNPLADGAISVSEISDLTASAAELNYNDITTLGTVEASKVVTADANGDVTFGDSDKAIFGAGSDLQIYHTGSNSHIKEVGTGILLIDASSQIQLRSAADEIYIQCVENSDVKLFHNNLQKLATTSTGIDVTGSVSATGGIYADTLMQIDNTTGFGKIEVGGASGAFIDLKIPTSDDYDGRIYYDGSKLYITAANNQPTQLRHDNSPKLATTSTGIDVTGELIADSYNETYAALSGTSPTVNCETGNAFSLTLSGNTTFTFSNPPASGTSYTFSIEIIQDAGASGYTVTWPSSVDWPAATAPTLTATASAKDIFVFTTRDGGTNWYGFTAGQALA